MDVRAMLSRMPGWAWFVAGAVVAALIAVIVAAATGADGEPAAASASPSASAATPSATASTGAEVAQTTAACTATAAVTGTWEGGFQAEVTVAAEADLDDWTVSLDLDDAAVTGSWSSTLEVGASGTVEVGPVDYNAAIAAGQSVGFGFTADGEAPEAIGAACATDAVVAPAPAASSTAEAPARDVPAAAGGDGDDWLRADGASIVDLNGDEVWLTGANWFGFNTSARVLHGLWTVDMEPVLDQVAARGINVLRVPISTELLLEWKAGRAEVSGSVNQAGAQSGLDTLEVFDAFLAACKERGVKVILDVHSALADDAGHLSPVWFAGDVTSTDFVEGWTWVAKRYRDDDTIVAFDLQNEPHGKASENPRASWGGGAADTDWKAVAEDLALRILDIHPNVLVMVEGIETYPKDGSSWSSTDAGDYDTTWWGGNLRGVADAPVDLGDYQDRLVYSPHEYGPLVYEQPWFQSSFSKASLEHDVWEPNWLYLDSDGIAPLLIGEWGGRLGQDERQDRWMTAVRDLIVERRLSHTFWCVNPNSGDTGGLLLDDWTTWDEEKYALLEPALWQDDEGRFVSLDHEVPLPGGITVTEFYEAGGSL
ncbi:cellulase family glycosylhydrolase [Demequina mangrovi]|uniref:Endoglucanase n=1 Tax=Demequina mangrovi TaxID=1043493 RepID=A0A1H6V794_9MICO|nr:cellulase family glycosylhydrolase [Demequina mangrovi]SEI99706.1 Aryl-phospho-beta-D-glucosidase BglC, GH1 family [Demequina mangrovi]